MTRVLWIFVSEYLLSERVSQIVCIFDAKRHLKVTKHMQFLFWKRWHDNKEKRIHKFSRLTDFYLARLMNRAEEQMAENRNQILNRATGTLDSAM